MDAVNLLSLTLVGVAAGYVNVMAGGGSLLSVPVLLLFGLSGPEANGSNRLAILAQNFSAVVTYLRSGAAEWRLSLTLSLAALPGAALGARVGVGFDGVWFERVVALVMLGVMALMVTGAGNKTVAEGTNVPRSRWWLGHAAMVGAGFWGGFMQVGVGFVIMPILNRVMGLSLRRTNVHKVFVILAYTICALTIFASHVEIAWRMGGALAAGNAVGGWLGARSNLRAGEQLIRRLLYAALGAFVVKLLFF